MSYFVLFILALLIIGYVIGKPYWREYQRKKIKQHPFKKQWRKILQRRVPYFRQMPADLQLQLKQLIQVFIEEKRFVGCDGVQINDEIRITIAAQACLLLLNRKTDMYPKLQTILVYPSGFIKREANIHQDGVQHIDETTLIGESWEFGQVVLSWVDTLEGANVPDDGRNVVIHEFAHQLDQENGAANGAPILDKEQNYKCWADVFSFHFQQLQYKVKTGQVSIFDRYGATNPAEFFAVASEVFFEKASELALEHPKLYRQLKSYYHVDPVHWQ